MFSNEMKEIKKKVLIIGFAALLVVGITPIAFSKGFISPKNLKCELLNYHLVEKYQPVKWLLMLFSTLLRAQQR